VAGEPEAPSGASKRVRDPSKKYWWATAIVVPIVVAVLAAFIDKWPFGGDHSPVPGTTYITSMTVIEKQYQAINGAPLDDPALKAMIARAIELATQKQFQAAVALIEQVPERAQVPAVLNDLGVAYAGLNDAPRARAAFEQALAKDANDAAAKANISALDQAKAQPPADQPPPAQRTSTPPAPIEPVKVEPAKVEEAQASAQEIEPNNDIFHANRIPLNAAIGAAIADSSDVDYFTFRTPPTYRDMIDVLLDNQSTSLQPTITLYTSDRSSAGSDANYNSAGNVALHFAAPPDAQYSISVTPNHGTSGAYQVTVRTKKAYDAFEPDDDVFHAKEIAIGRPVDASIMDGSDADYYKFTSDQAGKMVAWIENRSTDLQPSVTAYDPDRSQIGSNINYNSSGNTSLVFDVAAKSVYYMLVTSGHGTAGEYTLTLKLQ
jgi:tetratricopeptide (TPR) repeat protein